jgi:hypothetical protein
MSRSSTFKLSAQFRNRMKQGLKGGVATSSTTTTTPSSFAWSNASAIPSPSRGGPFSGSQPAAGMSSMDTDTDSSTTSTHHHESVWSAMVSSARAACTGGFTNALTGAPSTQHFQRRPTMTAWQEWRPTRGHARQFRPPRGRQWDQSGDIVMQGGQGYFDTYISKDQAQFHGGHGPIL